LLGPIQSLARRNLFHGTATQFLYIAKDEQLHVSLGLHLIRDFLSEHPGLLSPALVEQIIMDTEEALRLEDEFIEYALPGPIFGYNAADHKLTARFFAQKYIGRIGIHGDFGGKHMFPWMDEMVSTMKEVSFFERRNIEYQKSTLTFDDVGDQFESVMGN
jgi:ribonucleotide reductase beta subunit family protein with ferritin-like domain